MMMMIKVNHKFIKMIYQTNPVQMQQVFKDRRLSLKESLNKY